MRPNSAQQAAELALSRAHRPTMVAVTTERARREARASDRRPRRLSPLDGTPVVWKDLFDIAGVPTTAGSALLAGAPPAARDAALVRRLRDLGMVTIGKTNLSEFAFSGLGINGHFGTPVNPLDPARVPGGSSSGAAVAVATGIAPLAVGTDTSGSIRVPAAFTGTVGYRASHGRYGRNDFRALSPTLDCIGFVARSVRGIRLLDHLLAPPSDGAPAHRAVIPTGEWLDDCTPDIRSAFEDAVHRLQRTGITVTTRGVPALDQAQRLLDEHGTIVGAEAYATYGGLTGVEPATARRLRHNANVTAELVQRAMPQLRSSFRTDLAGAVLLCPTVRHGAPRIAELLASNTAYDAANASTLRTTMALSYLGACGVSLPVPGAGILVSAPEGKDATALATAQLFERELFPHEGVHRVTPRSARAELK
ncbi:amidase [Mycobacterium frederiksbergense]|uniref:Amidase n=1 Tax=Mycolicibacterium frederiksbergense TaxID=117567 RepID=A0A6H0S5Z4_9MYCO|nr:amidase family protein [Mycolicibacterium frederiksbergense]MCV7046251.1 amidase [Mycolicibacterium frederiksbergense]QIV82923.1 amidase [Mycolicibacterium frederiksbergense]